MPFPDGAVLSHILVIEDVERSVAWYRDVLGADLYRTYGTSAVFSFHGAWLVLVTGGGPTPDKPGVTMAVPDRDRVGHSMTLRVADCRRAHAELVQRGATFLTPPVETEWEVRAFFRDPDGHLFEISEAKSA